MISKLLKELDMKKNQLSHIAGMLSGAYKKQAEVEHEIQKWKAQKMKVQADIEEIQDLIMREGL